MKGKGPILFLDLLKHTSFSQCCEYVTVLEQVTVMLTDNGSTERESCDLHKEEKQGDNFRDRCESSTPAESVISDI